MPKAICLRPKVPKAICGCSDCLRKSADCLGNLKINRLPGTYIAGMRRTPCMTAQCHGFGKCIHREHTLKLSKQREFSAASQYQSRKVACAAAALRSRAGSLTTFSSSCAVIVYSQHSQINGSFRELRNLWPQRMTMYSTYHNNCGHLLV